MGVSRLSLLLSLHVSSSLYLFTRAAKSEHGHNQTYLVGGALGRPTVAGTHTQAHRKNLDDPFWFQTPRNLVEFEVIWISSGAVRLLDNL